MKKLNMPALLAFLTFAILACESDSLDTASSRLSEVDAIYVSDVPIRVGDSTMPASRRIMFYRDSLYAQTSQLGGQPYVTSGAVGDHAALVAKELLEGEALQRYCMTTSSAEGYESKFVIAYPEVGLFAYVVAGYVKDEVNGYHPSEPALKELVIFRSEGRQLTSFVSLYYDPNLVSGTNTAAQNHLTRFFGLPVRHIQAVGLSRDSMSHEVNYTEDLAGNPFYKGLRVELYKSLLTLRAVVENLSRAEGDFYITSASTAGEVHSVTDLMSHRDQFSLQGSDCTTIEWSVSTPIGGMCFKKTHVSDKSMSLRIGNDIRQAINLKGGVPYRQLADSGGDIWGSLE